MNAEIGSDNTLVGHVVGRHRLVDRNNNFYNFYRLAIDGALFKYKACHRLSWVSTDYLIRSTISLSANLPLASECA